MVPVLGGEVEEGEQRFSILGQAGDCLLVLGAVFVREHVDGHFGGRASRCAVTLTKVCLHVDLDRVGDAVEPDPSEGPWGRWSIPPHGGAVIASTDPTLCGSTLKHEGRRQTDRRSACAGSRLKL